LNVFGFPGFTYLPGIDFCFEQNDQKKISENYKSSGFENNFCRDTVDGRNPAPPGMCKTLSIKGYTAYQLVSLISSINSIRIVHHHEFHTCGIFLSDGSQVLS